MAERKAVNKYYPPDWTPSKGSINKHVGQHPLRDRAKKIKQGILVIRFEMPYNIWCEGCNAHIGMGVRYNAEKSRNGNYYTTPIYKFRMKCHLCDNYFEIQTDPQNHDYVILSGARRKEQRWDPKENGQIQTEDKATQKKMATDAMYKLEHGSDDHQKGRDAVMTLSSLEDRKEQFKDDYLLNKLARNKFRSEKNNIKDKQAVDQALLTKSSLDIQLVEEHEDDKRIAGLMKYSVVESYEEKRNEKRKIISNQPIFNSNSSTPNTTVTSHILNKSLNRYDPFNTSSSTPKTSNSKLVNLGIKPKGLSTPSPILRKKNNSEMEQNKKDISPEDNCDKIENTDIEIESRLCDNRTENQEDSNIEHSLSANISSNFSSPSFEDKGNSSNTGLSVLMSTYSESEDSNS